MTATPVVIDTDPGLDDAIAIMLALASPEVDVLGITTVAGNTTVENTTHNALRLLDTLGIQDIPVAAGADRPLVRPAREAIDHVHGPNGFGGLDLETNREPDPRHAVEFLRDTLLAADRPVTVIALAPLTNIALLLATYPAIAGRIERIVLMGGSVKSGNVTPAAEFNIHCDPEAAKRVFAADVDRVMVGLDVTDQAILLPSDWNQLPKGSPITELVGKLVLGYTPYHDSLFGFEHTIQHDALAVAAAIDPDILVTTRLYVDVVCDSAQTTGMTLADNRGGRSDSKGPFTEVALEVDIDRFKRLLISRLSAFPAPAES
jgi:pyrimidine-specific ribonucleoside hydrolase